MAQEKQMTAEQETLLLIQGHIYAMASADRTRVETIASTLRELVNENGGHGAMAMALVGAELAAKD